MTVLKGYSTLEEAHLGRSLLASEGIDAQVLDEGATVAPHLLLASGVRLAVADEDALRARETLGLSAVLHVVPRTYSDPTWMVLALGAAILTVLFFGLQQNRGSRVAGENRAEMDRNRDGAVDERVELDVKNRPVMRYEDNNFDGSWDRKVWFSEGTLVRAEEDLDFDGFFDSFSEYQNGVKVTELIRPHGEGFPLFRHEFKRGVRVLTWSDPDRDGVWKERIEVDALGREVTRTTVK